jgi:trehalose-phosphatase
MNAMLAPSAAAAPRSGERIADGSAPMGEATRIADWVTDWTSDGGHCLIVTDYDGTLAPLAASPAEARLPMSVRHDLEALARGPRLHLGVVSGRDVRDLRGCVGVAGAIYAGCYGLEIEGPGLRFRHPEAEAQRTTLGAIGRELSRVAPAVPGMRVEPKRLGVAVHYRDVAPDDVRRVEIEIARAIRLDGSRLKIFHGAKVIEIQPHAGWTKGDGVLWIRDAVRRASGDPLMVLYAGDDWTDEYVFEALAGQAITVRVGTDVAATRAAYRLSEVAHVRRLLAELAARASVGGAA